MTKLARMSTVVRTFGLPGEAVLSSRRTIPLQRMLGEHAAKTAAQPRAPVRSISHFLASPLLRGQPLVMTKSAKPVLANPLAPQRQQYGQNRSKFTMAGPDVSGWDMSDLGRLFETPELKALLRGATFVGVHGTSDANMKGIKESGIDLHRTGSNFAGYSAAGPGLYVSKDVTTGTNYAIGAATNGDARPQLMAVFRRPSSERINMQHCRGVARDASNVHELGLSAMRDATAHSTKITAFGINSEKVEYVAVQLPVFEMGARLEVAALVEKSLKESGFL